MPMLTQAEWMPLLPHAGAMRLLDSVQRWDASSITCRASSHKHCENPLRFDGCLPAVTGLEYAAQAMGIHTGLLNPDGLTAAHRTLPLGTKVRVVNQRNGRSVVVRINDRVPKSAKLPVDLSRGSARAIGMTGIAPVALYEVK